MKGDWVEVVIDSGDGTTRTYEVAATRAGRRVEVSSGRGIVEVSEVTRTGTAVRTARFMASRVVALVEHPADTTGADLGDTRGGIRAAGPLGYAARMDLLEPVVQPYAWGSREAIAKLQGRPVPSPGPEAELWMGAHPSAPSGVERDGRHTTLDAVIAANPAGELGEDCARRFGGRLPFLLKVLAAGKALSIQVHPSRAQAEEGYQADNERGLAPGDKNRNYVDDWPKPEILCALTPFAVLAGMRGPADAAALLRELGVPALAPLAGDLERADARADVLARILSWAAGERDALVTDVVSACERVAAEGGPHAAACADIAQVSADHPGDLGIVASLLLRHAVLQPGQAVFLPAGGLHAYLHGTGVELLANSDNVVRAGLTPKHIDIPELLKLTDPAVRVPLLAPRDLGNGISAYDSPAPEFRLYHVSLGADEVVLPGEGPRLVLAVSGTLSLRDSAGATLKLGRGESCFLSNLDRTTRASGPASAFLASVGEP